ncbi:MAG: type II toxin-antitoxin system RelE/ParE family toxin [Sphingobacterium hotanense]
MIKSFTNKALKALWQSGETKRLPPESVNKIIKILNYIDSINSISDLPEPVIKKYRIHALKKPPYQGFWSMDVSGNFRIIFRLENGDAYDLHCLDTH